MGKKKGRKKKRFTKYESQRIHAKRRFKERFGEPLKRKNLDEATRRIQKQEAFFMERQSHRITIWKLDVQGVEVLAVYDSNRKTICTFMDPNLTANPKEG